MDTKTAYIAKTDAGFRISSNLHDLTVKNYAPKKGKPTPIKHDPAEEAYEYASWGSNNDWPTKFRKKLSKIPVATRAMNKLVRMLYGEGVIYFKTEDLRKGSAVQRHYDERIENFIEENRINTHWLPNQCLDAVWTWHMVSEMILSNDKKEIAGIHHKISEYSRVSKQDEKKLTKDHLYYSEFFRDGMATEEQFAKLTLLPEYNKSEFIRNNTSKINFAFFNHLPSPGKTYYADHPANGLIRENGWADVALSVPEIISSMQRNQIALLYQINIPLSYFFTRYKDWNSFTAKEQEKIMNDKIDDLDVMLSDSANLYKSITNVIDDVSGVFGEAAGKIKIEAIDDKIKKDAWVPSSHVADTQITIGVGAHTSQLGLASDAGKIGGGSGSDQREAFNTEITLNTMDQIIILEPLNFISRFNNWGVTFRIDNIKHTTTNNQESGLVPSPHTTTVTDAD